MYRYEVGYGLDDGYWYERIYDKFGNQISYKDSIGYWYDRIYDKFGNVSSNKSGDDW